MKTIPSTSTGQTPIRCLLVVLMDTKQPRQQQITSGTHWDWSGTKLGSRRKPTPLGQRVPLEGVIAGPGALEQGMTGAAGTTHQKEVTFGGITALMVPITTLIEETKGPLGFVWGSGTLWCSSWSLWSLWSAGGPWGLFGGSWKVPLVLVSLKNQEQSHLNPLRGLPTAPLCCSYLLFLLVLMLCSWCSAWWVPRASLRVSENL